MSEYSAQQQPPTMPAEPPVRRRSGTSSWFAGALAGAGLSVVVVAAALTQGFGLERSTAQAAPSNPATSSTVNATAAAAPGTIAAVAQTVGPAIVSVRTDQGLGSGVVYDASGLILTNAHVVQGAQSITIGMVDGRHFPGKVVGADTGFDVAVIKIDGTNLPGRDAGRFERPAGRRLGYRHRQPIRVRSHADHGRRVRR